MDPTAQCFTGVRRRFGMAGQALASLALAWSCMGASCGQSALGVMPGIVNNSGNRSLRRAMLQLGTDEFCEQMLQRNIPLRLRSHDPATGRFYATTCQISTMPSKNLALQFTGHGYAWTNVTGRIGFEARGAVEYDQDLLMDGSTMYLYFASRTQTDSTFLPLMVERQGGKVSGMAAMLGTDMKSVAITAGQNVLLQQLRRGFTVVREGNGDTDFALGVIERETHPWVPFSRAKSSWPLLANEQTEVHRGQRDFAGPFRIPSDGDALHVTLLVEGAPTIDVLAVTKPVGDVWLNAYERQGKVAAPPNPPIFAEAIRSPIAANAMPAPGARPPLVRRKLRLPPGDYYLVFDNTASAGPTPPSGGPTDDRSALISYAVQLGNAD